ncbi:MAG: DUF916 domain-containing protein [Ktedonobacteraceae bacterium]|nr:DUF916 domain-containing protein [Ktedonobacteraceae bacterium]
MSNLYSFAHLSTSRTCKRSPGAALLIVVVLGILSVLAPGRALARNSWVAHNPIFSIMPFYSHKTNQLPRSYFIYNLQPDGQIQDYVQVKNTGTARGSVKLHPVDAFTAQTSGMAFHAHDDPRRDVGAWISLRSKPLTLNPGESVDIPFSLNVPEHVRPGQHYGGIIAESLYQPYVQSTGSDHNSIGIHIRSLIILGVSVTLPGKTVERLQATGVNYDQQSHYQRVLLQLRNTGTQMLHPFGSLHILDQKGKMLQNISLKLNAFLPQNAISYPVYIRYNALTPGKTYTAKIHLEYEHNHVLDYTTTFTVPLPSKPFPIPAVISGLVTPPTSGNFFSQLTLWYFIIAATILFLILTALFFWVPRVRKVAIDLKRRFLH